MQIALFENITSFLIGGCCDCWEESGGCESFLDISDYNLGGYSDYIYPSSIIASLFPILIFINIFKNRKFYRHKLIVKLIL